MVYEKFRFLDYLPAQRVPAPNRSGGKGSYRNFQPSLKGHSARQTASTRVQELSIRYVRAFDTSLGHLYWAAPSAGGPT